MTGHKEEQRQYFQDLRSEFSRSLMDGQATAILMAELMVRYCSFRSTDPKDKIYGLLGIWANSEDGKSPNYLSGVQKV